MSSAPACPRCAGPLADALVRTVIWQGESALIVEDIPAHVCGACMEQFYDDHVSDALRRLAEQSASPSQADRVMAVPVFSLKARLAQIQPLPEDVLVD